MSGDLPVEVDVWRAIAGRRVFSGAASLRDMPRLLAALEGAEPDSLGVCRYRVGFDTDPLAGGYVELSVQAELPLRCQRSLERFGYPVRLEQRLAAVRDEGDEPGLPEGYEPLLVGEEGLVRPLDLIEDELILAIPAVPVKPGSVPVAASFEPSRQEIEASHPFAALARLKRNDER